MQIQCSGLGAGITLDQVMAKLIGKPFRRPTHGPCCTCQTCGYDFDNCQCDYAFDREKAWDVVLSITKDMLQFRLENAPSDRIYAKFVDCSTGKVYGACAERKNVALAVCRAALKYVGRTE